MFEEVGVLGHNMGETLPQSLLQSKLDVEYVFCCLACSTFRVRRPGGEGNGSQRWMWRDAGTVRASLIGKLRFGPAISISMGVE